MHHILGIDVGSVAVSYVLLASNGSIVDSSYGEHHGSPERCLRSLLQENKLPDRVNIAATLSTPQILKRVRHYDDTVAWVATARKVHPKVRSLIIIGGERFSCVSFDENGQYRRMKTNTSCAAGTGSFLDQQSRRLNLSGSKELARLARENNGAIPTIASRCSVFAKTDIIHAQQEGYALGEICDGICDGLARNAADVLFDRTAVPAPAIFAGGVAKNSAVCRHLEQYLEIEIAVDEYCQIYGSYGAALCAHEELADGPLDETTVCIGSIDQVFAGSNEKRHYFHPQFRPSRNDLSGDLPPAPCS